MRFTQFYNTARCWPTRAALLTGYYAQHIHRDTFPAEAKVAGKRGRPAWARLLPDMLAAQGYRSYHTGKWHVDGQPSAGGFVHSYLLQDTGRYFSPQTHFEDNMKLPQPQRSSGYYTTVAMADHAIKCLKEHAAQHADKPFFHYLCFTAPHFPLHALPEDIARYKERYRQGWEAVRQQRWERQQSLGLVKGKLSPPERELGPPYHFPDDLKALGPNEVNRPLAWSALTSEQQSFQADKMSVHAAMIDRMDREIGRVLDQLRAMNAYDNTLIFFLSDNGASAEIMVRDDGHDPAAPPGSAASHLCLGPGWSTVANTPHRRHKTWVHEGGISTPLIAHWPQGIKAQGELRHTPGHVIDLAPTIVAVAGGKPFEMWDGKPVPKSPGQNLTPIFARDSDLDRDCLWWLHEGNRAVRVGNWKLVAARDEPWELYDLSSDRSETNNVAAANPDKVKELSAVWQRQMEGMKN